ncbi:MAG: type 1 glutamine amidotransferase [Actinomycetota bacterium]|nr:type 1 glutamine amidotransferase [Actinomycetota bacterium]
MKPIVVLRNEDMAPPGYLGDALDRRGVDWRVVRLDAGDLLPEAEAVSGVAILGGPMGAYDEEEFPFLIDEKRFLLECTDAAVPVLGICLGCQLLAEVLGGRAYLADRAEIVFAPIDATRDGQDDPVVAALAGRSVIRYHQDTFDVPPGGLLLATGGGFDQAFRLGSALGLQPHPEVTPDLLSGWLGSGRGRQRAIDLGVDPDVVLADFSIAEAEVAAMAAGVFDAWIDEVLHSVGSQR